MSSPRAPSAANSAWRSKAHGNDIDPRKRTELHEPHTDPRWMGLVAMCSSLQFQRTVDSERRLHRVVRPALAGACGRPAAALFQRGGGFATNFMEVKRNMMTIDLPTVDELALDLDGESEVEGQPTETA